MNTSVKTEFHPFYWMDVNKLEKRLSEMSADGVHLKKYAPLTGVFEFEKGGPAEKTYIIRSGKNGLPRSFREHGWQQICSSGLGYAAVFDGKNDDQPGYSGYLRLIGIIELVLFFVMCIFIGYIIGVAVGLASAASLPADDIHSLSGKIASGRLYILISTVIASVAVIAVLAGGFAHLMKCSKKYKHLVKADENVVTVPKENYTYTHREERAMLKEHTMIRKFRFAWYLSPDKGAEYVENMASQGWLLYRMSIFGHSFYFVKGKPCAARFAMDYQNELSEEYFAMNREAGWKLEFRSISRLGAYAALYREFESEEEATDFYTDGQSQIMHARRLAVTYGIFCGIMFVCSAVRILSLLWSGESISYDRIGYLSGILLIIALEMALFGGKSLAYYIRVRKKYQDIGK